MAGLPAWERRRGPRPESAAPAAPCRLAGLPLSLQLPGSPGGSPRISRPNWPLSMVSYLISASAIACRIVELVLDDLLGAGVVAVDDLADLAVDRMRGVVGDMLVWVTLRPEEHFALVLGIGQRSQLVRQAPLGDHVAGDLGRALDVVRGAGGDLLGAEDELFGDAAAEQRADAAVEPLLAGSCSGRSSGRNMVTPSARPRGMIVTL